MAFKEISPKLQLNFDEYVETWCSLLTEYYAQGLDSAITDDVLELDEQRLAGYGLELATVVLIIGMQIWGGRKGMPDEAKKKVHSAVVASYYEGLYGKDAPEFQKECVGFFNRKNDIFGELCRNLGGTDEKARQMELIGLARYLVAQVSDKSERQNQKAIELIGLLLINAGRACARLAKNTSQSVQVAGKPRFIVQK